jgi:hypothetical protein
MTTTKRKWLTLVAVLTVFGFIAAACGSDSADDSAGGGGSSDVAADLGACPNPIVFQTDWFPEPEHAALYNLTRGEGAITGEGIWSGPLAADPSIDVEIHVGGPYVGFQPTIALMALDDDIFLGFVNTDEAVQNFDDTPTISVFAPLEINPQMIMWDPATYDISSWDDVKGTGATINYFAGASYTEYLVGSGLVDESQLDGTYDGSPSRFIAEDGGLIQQGFITQEPYSYENDFEDWARPVESLLIHDAGFPVYQGALAIRADKFDDAAKSCLAALVPEMQRSAVDFQNDPGPTNAAILQAVVDLDSFWVLSDEGVANTHKVMGDLGIVSNGDNSTLGDFNLDRVTEVIDTIDTQVPSIAVAEGLTAEDLVTNEFIDDSIGL